jgi:Peptidyl-tRNA hydrolase PTH2
MKLTLVVRADLSLGRGKIAAQAAHAAMAAALANLDTPDFRAWLRTAHCEPAGTAPFPPACPAGVIVGHHTCLS